MKLRVIIGQGTSAEVYQYTGTAGEYITVAIGPRGLWAALPNAHRMGQPAHLLALPGAPVPAFGTATGSTAHGLGGFLDVNTYDQSVQALANRVRSRDFRLELPGTVVRVVRQGLQILVQFQWAQGNMHILADQVIFASGIGPQKTPADARITVRGTKDNALHFTQIEEGTDYLQHGQNVGRIVVVYGGGPTGAWAAAEVDHQASLGVVQDWCWMARAGGEGFGRSVLPGDRNWAILQNTDRQVRYGIQAAHYRAQGSLRAEDVENGIPPRPPRSMVELTIVSNDNFTFPFLVDQLIYCIGGNPAGAGSIARTLEEDLIADLHPVTDRNMMLGGGDGVLAWATRNREVMIVGAAAFNFQAPQWEKTTQTAPMDTLPPNAQVPDGIAVAISTIEALNDYIPATPVGPAASNRFDWTLNVNTANRTQIATFIAQETDLEPFTANLLVALLIHLRSKNTFGLSNPQVLFIASETLNIVRALKNLSPNLDAARRQIDRIYGADHYLQYIVGWVTGEGNRGKWMAAGIRS